MALNYIFFKSFNCKCIHEYHNIPLAAFPPGKNVIISILSVASDNF